MDIREIKPLQWITVTKGDKTFSTGSIGMFVCKEIYQNYNTWACYILITKVGKRGKNRITPRVLYIADTSCTSNYRTKQNILDSVKFGEQLVPSVVDDIEMDIIQNDSIKNVVDLPSWKFLTHVAALSMYLKRLESRIMLPLDSAVRFSIRTNTVFLPLLNIPIRNIGPRIMSQIFNKNRHKEQAEMLMNYISDRHTRIDIITHLMRYKSIMCNSVKEDDLEMEKMGLLMDQRILHIIDFYKKNPAIQGETITDPNVRNIIWEIRNTGIIEGAKRYDYKRKYAPPRITKPILGRSDNMLHAYTNALDDPDHPDHRKVRARKAVRPYTSTSSPESVVFSIDTMNIAKSLAAQLDSPDEPVE